MASVTSGRRIGSTLVVPVRTERGPHRSEAGWHRGRSLRPSKDGGFVVPLEIRSPMTTLVPPLAPVQSLELAADTLTPVAAALRLAERCAFLLESVE